MSKVIPLLSRGMLVAGGLMILAGLGWGIWERVNAPPPPTITEAGAVVLAVTAPSLARSTTPEPTEPPASPTLLLTPSPTQPIDASAPAPALLPDWSITAEAATPEPTSPPATPLPPTPTPTPTNIPKAQEPPSRIVASAIDLDTPVVPMGWQMVDHDGTMTSEWIVPEKAAGWHMNSALPGNGENVVLSGHHNIKGKVFRYVVDLEPGDEITLYAGDIPYTYFVAEKYILKEAGMPLRVRQKNAQWIMPSGDERLTLVTCWPYEWPGNSHRVIIVARPPGFFEALSEELQSEGAK